MSQSTLSDKEKELLEIARKNGLLDPIRNTQQTSNEKITITSLVGSLTCIILFICVCLCAIKFTSNYTGWF